jgi:DNA mismatch repair protein MutL
VAPFGQDAFIIQGIPADMEPGREQQTLEGLLEQFKHFSNELKADKREKVIRSLARQRAVKPGKLLDAAEMQNLIDQLFACSQPQVSPGGSYTYITFRLDEISSKFQV